LELSEFGDIITQQGEIKMKKIGYWNVVFALVALISLGILVALLVY
jgi:hypothetical protein|tara:strand:+ start:274 stop:411 length:138 start_codon:yes stop_codon:yes gene_type:complete